MCLITVGFGLMIFHYTHAISKMLAIHAFAYGGIGLVTFSMIVRVSLGHTGRDIHSPPVLMKYAFILLLAGFITRVLLPIIYPQHYSEFIIVSQLLWITSYVFLVTVFIPVWFGPRFVDNLP